MIESPREDWNRSYENIICSTFSWRLVCQQASFEGRGPVPNFTDAEWRCGFKVGKPLGAKTMDLFQILLLVVNNYVSNDIEHHQWAALPIKSFLQRRSIITNVPRRYIRLKTALNALTERHCQQSTCLHLITFKNPISMMSQFRVFTIVPLKSVRRKFTKP